MNKKKNENTLEETEIKEETLGQSDEGTKSIKKDSLELDECRKRVSELENLAKRALADYQNLEKRVREEKTGWIRLANKELILRMLPLLDTLILAKKHSQDQTLQVVMQQFLDVLKNEGVERIETAGKDFDPHLMECVTTGNGKEGKVLLELKAGYTIGDKVLRPAQVKVGKGK